MALDDYFESEVAVAVAAAAVVFSPRVRNIARQGAVYGLAGVLMAGDAIGSFARGIGRGVQQATSTDAAGAATQAATEANGSSPTRDAGPGTPDAAADELAAVASAGAGDAASRRSRRPRAEQIESTD